jgi:hypothetical protein
MKAPGRFVQALVRRMLVPGKSCMFRFGPDKNYIPYM